MQLSPTRLVTSAVFDALNLGSAAGLVPLVKVAQTAGMTKLAAEWATAPTAPTGNGANAGLTVTSLVARDSRLRRQHR